MIAERWRCFVAVPIGDTLRTDLLGVVDEYEMLGSIRLKASAGV